MRVSPELKVNQLLQIIDLEIMGKYIDLRAVDQGCPQGLLIFCEHKGVSYVSESQKILKRWLC